jgi:hypothetical protein
MSAIYRSLYELQFRPQDITPELGMLPMLQNVVSDFHEIWYERYAIEDCPKLTPFDFLH